MSDQQRSISFGFPEFWPTVVAEYPEFFARKGRLDASINSVIRRKYEHLDPQQLLLHDILMLVIYGFNETVALVGNGMGLGAMKIVRNTFENAINAKYIQLFPEQAENYLGWQWVENHKSHINLQRDKPLLWEQIPESERLSTEIEYEHVRHLFSYEVTNSKGVIQKHKQREWCRVNLYERASTLGPKFADLYAEVMPIANSLLHGSINGLLSHINRDNGQFEPQPSLKFTGHALCAAHAATLITLDAVTLQLDCASDVDLEELTIDYEAIWYKKPRQEVL